MIKEGLTRAQAHEEWDKLTYAGKSGLVRPIEATRSYTVFSPASEAIGHPTAAVHPNAFKEAKKHTYVQQLDSANR